MIFNVRMPKRGGCRGRVSSEGLQERQQQQKHHRSNKMLKNLKENSHTQKCSWKISRSVRLSYDAFELRVYHTLEAGIAQWLERRTSDWKVAGSNPCWSGGRIFFSRVYFLCWLLFRYPFHPRVTAVARKRSRSFCQKCRWQVTAKHAYTLRMWLWMKWHGARLYGVHRTCAETAAVSCGTSKASAVSTPLRWILKLKKTRYKASHSCKTTCERSESAQESGE